MASKEKQDGNPVAKLRERYFEKRNNRKPPSKEIKEIFKKDKERSERNQEPEKKIASPGRTLNEADI